MSDQAITVKNVSIERMTIDLFLFWLDFDWHLITRNVTLLSEPTEWHKDDQEKYYRLISVSWALESDGPEELSRSTNIAWGQIRTDTVEVEFIDNGQLANDLSEWLLTRFGVTAKKDGTPMLSNVPTPKLTPTETKVAKLLAQNLDYEQIGVRLGNKSIHAARKHAQNIAKKWNTKQVVEILWSEAKKRGYSIPDTI
jgi:DNA-binding CsgD family transcriptional regulator